LTVQFRRFSYILFDLEGKAGQVGLHQSSWHQNSSGSSGVRVQSYPDEKYSVQSASTSRAPVCRQW